MHWRRRIIRKWQFEKEMNKRKCREERNGIWIDWFWEWIMYMYLLVHFACLHVCKIHFPLCFCSFFSAYRSIAFHSFCSRSICRLFCSHIEILIRLIWENSIKYNEFLIFACIEGLNVHSKCDEIYVKHKKMIQSEMIFLHWEALVDEYESVPKISKFKNIY